MDNFLLRRFLLSWCARASALLAVALFGWLALFSVVAFGAFPAVAPGAHVPLASGQYYSPNSYTQVKKNTPTEVCTDDVAGLGGVFSLQWDGVKWYCYYSPSVWVYINGWQWVCPANSNNAHNNHADHAGGIGMCVTTVYTCPANSTLSGTNCTCNSGYVESGGACVAPTCPTGQSVSYTEFVQHQFGGNSYGPLLIRIGGSEVQVNIDGTYCKATLGNQQECFQYVDAPTKTYCTYSATTTGALANTQNPGAESPTLPSSQTPNTSNPCPEGYSYGTVNGIGTCLSSGSSPATTSTPAPTPSVTQQSTTSSTSGDVTTTVTTTTTNNSVTTTTTTVNNVTGEKTVTSETKGVAAGDGKAGATDQAQFCRDNPESPICKVSSVSGSCETFTCNGDAAQCAIAKAAQEMRCEMLKDGAKRELGAAIINGTDPDAENLPKPSNPTVVDVAGSISTTEGFLGTNSCPGDQSYSILGQTIVIPFDQFCTSLQFMGAVLVAVTLIGCACIVGIRG